MLFLAEIANFNVFFFKKHQLLPPKKYRGGQEKNRGGKNENRGALPPCPPAGDAPAWGAVILRNYCNLFKYNVLMITRSLVQKYF